MQTLSLSSDSYISATIIRFVEYFTVINEILWSMLHRICSIMRDGLRLSREQMFYLWKESFIHPVTCYCTDNILYIYAEFVVYISD